ncbi:MAG: Fe-S protein assembly co-chaperone HscB [Rhodoferax sp.]|nr:Fe-S protein assembly co-chaperone HscB [Rhodoferax sp.]
MNLQSSDFELFGLTPGFAQDRAFIDVRWKDLQREVHPDKFAAQGAAAQRISMQWSVRINEAYQRLKEPLKRAAYLCELNGVPVNAENNTAMPAEFLMQQMEWREALDEATTTVELNVLDGLVRFARVQALQLCAEFLDDKQDYQSAVGQVRALMFIDRFSRDIEARLDQMDTTDGGQ